MFEVLEFIVSWLPEEQIKSFAQGEQYQGWIEVQDGFLVYEGANFHDMAAILVDDGGWKS